MQRTTHQRKQTKHAGKAWLGALIPLSLIAIAAGVFVLISQNEASQDQAAAMRPTEPKTLTVGNDYYLMVRTIELYPMRPGGEVAWDRLDKSGPDIQFTLTWQDNVVFESQKKSDTLIGAWDLLAIDVKNAVLNGKVDLASSIDAAIIRVEEDTEIEIEVWDADLPGSDAAGSATMKLSQYKPGDNTFNFKPSDTNAIKRIVVRVVDRSLPVKELVEEATRP